ncbi:hypothetical protein [Taibaiella koreensis]|uniref:hypothetical protein n=1 Tax=Taibaiella koreensis TaxID=1268548 RepID=UPI000E59C558|nr:hypothetical protein [Taibaiella koreensis]
MNLKIVLSTILLFAFLNACYAQHATNQKIEGKSFLFEKDRLSSKRHLCKQDKNPTFLNFKGIQFSSSYVLIDSLNVDLNKDGIADWIVILSPRIQELDQYKDACYKTVFNTRLLMAIISEKGSYHVSAINENLILNRFEYQSEPYRKIEKEVDGFVIRFYIGSVIRCNYDFHFTANKGGPFLSKTSYDCYRRDLSRSAQSSLNFKNANTTSLSKINIRPFIRIPNLK